MIFRSPYPDVVIPDVPLTPIVLRHAVRLADKPALIDGPSARALTYGQLAAGVRRVASGLARRGFGKDDVFATVCPLVPEFALVFYGVASLGGATTMLSPLYTAEEMHVQFADAGSRFVVTMPERLATVRAAVTGTRVEEIFVLGDADGATPFSVLLQHDGPLPSVAIDPDDVVLLPYSSGTTGHPKGVMLTHRNMVANVLTRHPPLPTREDDMAVTASPYFNISGINILHTTLHAGATLVLLPRFELRTFLQILQDYRATRVNVPPPIALELSRHPMVAEFDLSRLELILWGSAPMAETVARACRERLGVRMKQCFGLTEGSGLTHVVPADAEDRQGSAGPPLPGTEYKIVDVATGAALGPGQAGEICLRGPLVMKGYLNQPAATAQAIDDEGWLHTGDLGCADEGGWLTVVDRLKELIKYKGYQVAPAELEAVLLSHPAVADAAVIPSPDEEAGEVPKAFIVLQEQEQATPDELIAFVAARVAPYKKVRRIEFIAQIPKSAAGKILRRALVEHERAAALVLAREEPLMVATVSAVPRLAGVSSDEAALAEVERRFADQLSPRRLYPGAALAVYRHGRLILDLTAGFADTQRGELVRADTLFLLFSSTKPLASVALWQQIERGAAGLDDPVAAHWPAFAGNGKAGVTLRHILSHRGGFPLTPPSLVPEHWGDWEYAVRTIAAMPLSHEPGVVSTYHHLTQQWVCAEVVRRLDGRAYRDYLRTEITGPLGMTDTVVGLPDDHEERAALLHATESTDERERDILRRFNRRDIRRAVVPAATGFSTARDMARFYAALADGGALDGGRILQPETVTRMLGVEVDGEIDRTFDVPIRRGLGFELGGQADVRRHSPGATSTARTFWHGGFGSSVCWGDPDLHLAMAFLSNGVRRDEAGATARRDLSDAVRAAVR